MTRAELMTVLSGLEAVRLRGLYFSETQRLSLSGVGLEEASDTGSGRRAHTVEMCACPPDYTGDSCQVGNSPVHASAPGTPGHCPAPAGLGRPLHAQVSEGLWLLPCLDHPQVFSVSEPQGS